MWPQLEQILGDYIKTIRPTEPAQLLFANPSTGRLLVDVRKALDAIAVHAGFKAGSVRPYAFRHTYCAARLQTLDNGAPISPFTVAKELGHGGFSLVNHVYGHLGYVRHRSDVVEFETGQHREQLAERFERFQKTLATLP